LYKAYNEAKGVVFMVINELLEVLFFRNLNDLFEETKYLHRRYYPHDLQKYEQEFDSYVHEFIKSKDNLLNIIEDYHQNGFPIWQQQEAQNCDNICNDTLASILKNGTDERGKERYHLYQTMKEKWACHLDDYSRLVNHEDSIKILELATGAGLGTCAVMKDLQPNSILMSIDIDFGAAKNADGLAKYFKIENRACALNANFWNIKSSGL
jgi:hypothetical protein